MERGSTDPLGDFAKKLQVWDVTTVFPLVLRLATEDMKEDELSSCLDAVLSFVVRRAVCGLSTKNYNKFFLTVVRALDREGWNEAVLCKFLLSQTSDSGRFPNNQEFERSWVRQPVYRSLSAQKVRALLEPLEMNMRSKLHETSALRSDLTIEHLLPHSWWDNWPLPDGTMSNFWEVTEANYSLAEVGTRKGQIAARETMKHTIGNLTLLTQSFNSQLSNGSWASKRKALQDHSLLVMNRAITKVEKWDESEIESRSHELFTLAREIWGYPEVD